MKKEIPIPTKEQLQAAIGNIIIAEKGGHTGNSYKKYVADIVELTGLHISDCATCKSLVKRNHCDFQIWIWNKVNELYPELNLDNPRFASYKMLNAHWDKRFNTLCFEHLKNLLEDLRAQATKFLRSGNTVAAGLFSADADSIRDYINAKMNYSSMLVKWNLMTVSSKEEIKDSIGIEIKGIDKNTPNFGNSKIDKPQCWEMHKQGKNLGEIGEHFGVDKSTVSKMLKKMRESGEFK